MRVSNNLLAAAKGTEYSRTFSKAFIFLTLPTKVSKRQSEPCAQQLPSCSVDNGALLAEKVRTHSLHVTFLLLIWLVEKRQ